MRAMRFFACLAVVACSISVVPIARAERHSNVQFARVPMRLDAFVPDGKGPFPALILVHGGALTTGDKQMFIKPVFAPLERAGFAYFTINYRLGPQYGHPEGVEDVESAVRWVRANARKYKVDPKRIAILGESAGGYLVSLAGARRKVPVAAVISFYGKSEYLTDLAKAEKPRGNLENWFHLADLESPEALAIVRDASPIIQIERDPKSLPPYLLVHSKDDPQVPFEQSEKLCARMTELGASCELHAMDGMGHGMAKWAETPAEQEWLVAWLKARLGTTERK